MSDETMNLHRAIASLKEELDAIDWYQQRADACSDSELRAVLLHNKNEEVEHAAMLLEWLRRNSSVFATNIQTYVGGSGSITETETKENPESNETSELVTSVSLGIGGLKGLKS
jgi:uncharacterized protein